VSPRRKIFADDAAAVFARHRTLLALSRRRRGMELGVALTALTLTLFSIWWLGIAIEAIGPGLESLASAHP
jgi:hypothetical protein